MSANRPPAVAGRFYPGTREVCEYMAREFFRGITPTPAVAGIVPHAGWVYSGATAAFSIAAVVAAEPETIIIFGAVHHADANPASICAAGSWTTPMGELQIDEELAREILQDRRIVDAPGSHRYEHSIEVQLPLLQFVRPSVKIVPIGVRPGPDAAAIGRSCAACAKVSGRRVGFLGSTDLTHYGPVFGFEPHGHGPEGVRWAKEVNDRRVIRLIQAMDADGVVPEATLSHNACGPGAVAATIGAALEIGGLRYLELRHTCSAEAGAAEDRDPYNSVGYEAGVFVRGE